MKCIYANSDQEAEIYMDPSRRSLIKMIGLLTFGLSLLISACDQSNADFAPTVEIKKESKEDYHQKYQLRQRRQLMAEFKAMYSRNIDFVNSTAAARVNGYVGGHGEPEEIADKIKSLGLSNAGQKRLLEISNNWKN
jgi:hypothetical protein